MAHAFFALTGLHKLLYYATGERNTDMQKKRVVIFLVLYAAIVAAMLFVYLVIQARYGVEPGSPSKRRFFDKFFIEVPSPHTTLLASANGAGVVFNPDYA
jgi:hypothetical protein